MWRHDIQHNDTQQGSLPTLSINDTWHNDTQHKDTQHASIECRFKFAKCRNYVNVKLSVVMLTVVILRVVARDLFEQESLSVCPSLIWEDHS